MPERLAAARAAQGRWRKTPLRERLRSVCRARHLIAQRGAELARAAAGTRRSSPAEKLTAEVIPLAAACVFLEREAERWLRPRRVGLRGRPLWLAGVKSVVHHEPYGVVLVVGPANYPLFLPGVQLLQALTAGNAVLLKPGREGTAAAALLAGLLEEAGLAPGLVQLLPEPPEQVAAALEAGVDLVVFTGSSESGRAVLAAAARVAVPVIAELSGDDPFILRDDADADLAAAALRFGRDLNGGDSCIAPRRVCAPARQAAVLREEFPGLAVQLAEDDAASSRAANDSPYALGAAIISHDEAAALRLAEEIDAGLVVINDCVMPSADPRLPFGGRRASGFGVTRGPEGLLALTQPKVITIQRGARRHLATAQPDDEAFFLAYLQAAHGGNWRHRATALLELIRRGLARKSAS